MAMANLAVPVAVMANDKPMKARTMAPTATNRSQPGRAVCCPCSCLLTEIPRANLSERSPRDSSFSATIKRPASQNHALTRGATSWHKERRRQIALGFGVRARFWINQPNGPRLIRIERAPLPNAYPCVVSVSVPRRCVLAHLTGRSEHVKWWKAGSAQWAIATCMPRDTSPGPSEHLGGVSQ
jgi:hypothetical protein